MMVACGGELSSNGFNPEYASRCGYLAGWNTNTICQMPRKPGDYYLYFSWFISSLDYDEPDDYVTPFIALPMK